MHTRRLIAGLVLLLILQPKNGATAEPLRTDRHGDPLPPGALARLGTVRFRHGDWIRYLVFSPDGRSIASLGKRERIHVWDAASGREQAHLPGCFRAVVFSRDGRTLATASAKGSLDLWDQRGKKKRTPRSDPAGFLCAAFSADGKSLAAVIPGRVILIWDVNNGRELHRLADHTDKVDALCLSADGRTLAAGDSEHHTIRLWDVAAERKPRQLGKVFKKLTLLALAPNGKTFAAIDEKGSLVLWDAIVGKVIRTLRTARLPITKAAFSADGQRLAVSFSSEQLFCELVGVWETASGKEVRRFGPFGVFGSHQTGAFSPDGKRLATGGWDNTVRLFDVANGKELQARDGPVGRTFALCFAADGEGIVTAGMDGPLRFWDAATGRLFRSSVVPGAWVNRLTCSPDGRTLALILIGSPIPLALWDYRTGKEIGGIEDSELLGANDVVFSPPGKRLLLAGIKDGLLEVDASNGKRLRSLLCQGLKAEDDGSGLSAPVISPDGKRVAAALSGLNDNDRSVHWWDLASGQELSPLRGPPGLTTSLAFSADGKTLAALTSPKEFDDKQKLVRWEVETSQHRPLRLAGVRKLSAFAFAANPRVLATADAEEPRRIRLWDTAAGTEIRSFDGHRGHIDSLTFSPDGRTLVSKGDDTTLLIWDTSDLVNRKFSAIRELSPRQLADLWSALGGDAARAGEVMSALIAGRQTIAFLREHVHPIAARDTRRIARWIEELDSDEFAVREKATRELAKLGELAVLQLRKKQADRPPLEVRRRIEDILAHPRSIDLRLLRAIEILEHIGNDETRQLLRTLAQGAPEARLTQESRAALKRLERWRR